MDLIVEPMKENDLDDLVRIYWNAFEPLEANLVLPIIYPDGLQPDFIHRFKSRILQTTNGDVGSQCYCARDRTTGAIAGVSRWTTVLNPPQTDAEIIQQYEKAKESREAEPPVAGHNKDLDFVYLYAAFHSEINTCKGQPHMTLQLMAIEPKFHRKGLGSLLMKHGLEKADAMGLPVYVAAGTDGKALYERFGFEVTGGLGVDCREYGGRSSGEHWSMLRPARVSGAMPNGTDTGLT